MFQFEHWKQLEKKKAFRISPMSKALGLSSRGHSSTSPSIFLHKRYRLSKCARASTAYGSSVSILASPTVERVVGVPFYFVDVHEVGT